MSVEWPDLLLQESLSYTRWTPRICLRPCPDAYKTLTISLYALPSFITPEAFHSKVVLQETIDHSFACTSTTKHHVTLAMGMWLRSPVTGSDNKGSYGVPVQSFSSSHSVTSNSKVVQNDGLCLFCGLVLPPKSKAHISMDLRSLWSPRSPRLDHIHHLSRPLCVLVLFVTSELELKITTSTTHVCRPALLPKYAKLGFH